MKRPPFLENMHWPDNVTRFRLLNMIIMRSYPPHSIIPIDDEYIYVVKKGMIKCSFIDKSKDIDVFLLVEGDVFGNSEQKEILPAKYHVQYYSLENTCVFLVPKIKWYFYVSTISNLYGVWMKQLELQKDTTQTWLRQFRKVKKETLLMQLLKEKPQLLKRDRFRHVVNILHIESQ
ncbi:MAG: hypothetical protein H6Q17_264 [Bacteroidetes bacterium]|jgi:hypothetical protein|nr:hypothetical protein [Bacteroidota bacterium]